MSAEAVLGGRFRLVEKIGTGGMGVVYRALDEITRRPVAIKLLGAGDLTDQERARREARVLAKLAHPGIVGYVADGVTGDDRHYLAMEWIDGITVADRIVTDGFSLREALVLARRLASALAAAHGAGVLHRDVTPSNVILAGGDPDRATLIDFGVARTADALVALTRPGATIGTPGYMAPEQARGERVLTPSADVFGLGTLLYECATGFPAFSGAQPAAVLTKVLFAEPAPFPQLVPEAPGWVCSLIDGMLRKSLADRIASCERVCAALATLDDVPDAPRRHAQHLVRARTLQSSDTAVHCMVLAARGLPDELRPPPLVEEMTQLEATATVWGARIEVCATGALIAHLQGQPDEVIARAASCALAMCAILADWSVVLSAPDPDAAAAAENGMAMLTAAAVGAIFQKRSPRRDAITIDPGCMTLLERDFEIECEPAGVPRLVGRRTTRHEA